MSEQRVKWPGVGVYWLDRSQYRAVHVLADAYLSGRPEVSGRKLSRAAGGDLREVFAGSPAWGELVVPGEEPDTYRLPDPEGED